MNRPAHFFTLLTFCISALMAHGQETPRHRQPNTKINETLIDYGRTPQKAEESVLQQAKIKAFDGDFELKNINISGRDDDYYCVIQIEHEVYRPQNRRPIDEMTVGYGRTMPLAEIDARYKAERMINDRLNSSKERRKREEARALAAQNRESAATSHDYVILDKDDDTSYILKSIRFSGRPDDYQCYIKFEYLVMK